MSLVPSSDLKKWVDLIEVLGKRLAADLSNGIIIDHKSIMPDGFPDLRFEDNKYIMTSPEYPDIGTIRVILMARYEELRRVAMGA